jgi:hypothetical protein
MKTIFDLYRVMVLLGRKIKINLHEACRVVADLSDDLNYLTGFFIA